MTIIIKVTFYFFYFQQNRTQLSPADDRTRLGLNGRTNGSPSALSSTPSPAGSESSEVGSQSSGYTTSTEGRFTTCNDVNQTRQRSNGIENTPYASSDGSSTRQRSNGIESTPPHIRNRQMIEVPNDVHWSLVKQHQYQNCLVNAFELWSDADRNINEDPQINAFFICLDKLVGPLNFHSPLTDLVDYVRTGLSYVRTEVQQNRVENNTRTDISNSVRTT